MYDVSKELFSVGMDDGYSAFDEKTHNRGAGGTAGNVGDIVSRPETVVSTGFVVKNAAMWYITYGDLWRFTGIA